MVQSVYPIQFVERLAKKYVDIDGQIMVLEIEKRDRRDLGISLAGNRDTARMSVFVCGIRPDGAAAEDGRLKIGDELLEANGQVLLGKSHLNAAPIIIGCRTHSVKLVIVRRPGNIGSMAVKPIQPPISLPVDYTPANAKPPETVINPGELEKLAVGSLRVEQLAAVSDPAANGYLVRCESPPVAETAEQQPQQPQPPPTVGPYGVEYSCTLAKGKYGLGFAIMERNFNDEPGIYVKHITDKGPAAAEGTLRTGDRLLRANEFHLAEATYDEALDRLRSMSGDVAITVGRLQPTTPPPAPVAVIAQPPVRKEVRIATPERDLDDGEDAGAGQKAGQPQSQKQQQHHALEGSASAMVKNNRDGSSAASAASAAAPAASASASAAPAASTATSDEAAVNPATCDIPPVRETVIEISKGDNTLGISIVGGSDTTLSAIVIHEVYDAGAAGIDGRLRPGDQILAVGDRQLAGVTHEEAKAAILQAGPRVRLRVWRDDKAVSEADLYDVHKVDLVRKPGRGLGFSIVGRSRDEGVLVSDIIKGGAAESDNRLQPGDRILEINGTDVRKTPHSEVAAMLKSTQGKVSFLIGRLKHVAVSKSKKKCGGF